MTRKKIIVIDGQGGGIGSMIIMELKKQFGEIFEITALGTNSIATAAMLSAGANKGGTGENAIRITVKGADYIIGSINIVLPNSMMGELTSAMSESIADSPAKKILVPLSQENIEIMGIKHEPLPHLVNELLTRLKSLEA